MSYLNCTWSIYTLNEFPNDDSTKGKEQTAQPSLVIKARGLLHRQETVSLVQIMLERVPRQQQIQTRERIIQVEMAPHQPSRVLPIQ